MKLYLYIIFACTLLTSVRVDSQNKNWVEKHYIADEFEEFTKLKCTKDSICYIFGNNTSTNRLYKSTNQGSSWVEIYSRDHLPYRQPQLKDTVWNLGECDVINDSCFFLSYYDSNVLDITKDGGKTFRRIEIKGTYTIVEDLNMFNENIGIASTDTRIAVTLDGWQTHEVYYFDKIDSRKVSYYLDSVNIALKKNRYGGGYSFENFNLLTGEFTDLFDDGLPNDSSSQIDLWNVYFVNKNLGFGAAAKEFSPKPNAYLRYESVLKTTDGGRSWKVIYESNDSVASTYSEIAFENENHGFRCRTNKWSESFDGGVTWTEGYSQKDFARGLADNIIFVGGTAIYACRRIYRFEEVNEDINAFYFNREDSTEYCFNGDEVQLKTLMSVENYIEESNNSFTGDGVEWLTKNNKESDPLSGFYFFPSKVEPGEIEITNIFMNKARYSTSAVLRDTVFKIKVNSPASDTPRIYSRNDTLFTQYPIVDWYRLDNMLKVYSGNYFVPELQIEYFAKYTDINGCEISGEIFDFKKTSVGIETEGTVKTIDGILFLDSKSFELNNSVDIYNINGIRLESLKNTQLIDFNPYPHGLYLVRIVVGDKAKFIKILN